MICSWLDFSNISDIDDQAYLFGLAQWLWPGIDWNSGSNLPYFVVFLFPVPVHVQKTEFRIKFKPKYLTISSQNVYISYAFGTKWIYPIKPHVTSTNAQLQFLGSNGLKIMWYSCLKAFSFKKLSSHFVYYYTHTKKITPLNKALRKYNLYNLYNLV